MLSLSGTSFPDNQREIREVMSEIAFQKVLLSSIDDSVEDREAAEAEVRAEIKKLEKRARALRLLPTSAASNSRVASSTQPAGGSPQPNSHTEAAMDGSPAAGSQNDHQARDPSHSLAPALSASSSDTLSEILSPSKMTLPSRKRSHSKQDGGLAPFQENKSRRTSPSPYVIDSSTPNDSSGDEHFETFDKAFFNQTISQEQQYIEDKIKQERLDAELAKSLQDGTPINTAAPNSSTGPTAFDRMSGVRPSKNYSPKPRGLPWATSNTASTVKHEPRPMNSNIKREEPSSSSGLENGSHRSNDFRSSYRDMPGAFRDDSSSADDSDIEIIPADAFHENGRYQPTPTAPRTSLFGSMHGTPRSMMQHPSYSQEAQNLLEPSFRQVGQASTNHSSQLSMLGNQSTSSSMKPRPLPNSSQTMNAPGAFSGSTIYGTPKTFGSGAGSLTFPGAGLIGGIFSANNAMFFGRRGGSMQNAEPGLGSTLNNAADVKNEYNINQQDPAFRARGIGSLNPFSQNLGDLMPDLFSRPMNEKMGEQYDYIMNDPRKTYEEITTLLQNIRPDEDLPAEDREGTPEGLVYPLYEHQKLALTWLKSMEEGTNKGGILADDMGLGKTISSLALILSRPSTDVLCKTTLIVGPVALLHQWEREIRTKVTASHRLSTHMCHGAGRKISWDDLRTYDIIFTTYGTLGAENKRLDVWLQKQKSAGHEHDFDQAPMKKLFPLLGPKSLFYRVILDEAQCIKNKATNQARAAKLLQAKTRFCLTGTPMMNNVGELYSLIHFLRIRPYNDWTEFQLAFGKLTKGDASQKSIRESMRKLQAVLKAILLRRTKTSLIDGKPIINLPPKTEEIQHVVFDEEQQAFYSALESKTQIRFNKYLRANTVGKNYANVLVLLLRLRQVCCHPHLIMDFEEAPPAGVDLTAEAMIELAKSLAPDVIARLLAAEGFECPVCYDGVENPSIAIPCGHDTCAECLSKISDQADQQNQAEGNEAGASCKCPTCRGKIDLKKIIDYATFKKVHMRGENAEDDIASINDDSETDSETASSWASETESEGKGDADQNGDLRGFIVPDDIEDSEDEEEGGEGDDEAERAPRKSKPKKSKNDKRRRSKAKKNEEKVHISLSVLKKEASRSADGRRKYMRYLRKNWQPSAKVDKCVELLEQFHNDGKKTIIFSQFVALLDLLQVPIDQKGWKCERYDGAMNATARNNAIVRFTDRADTKVMLISLKAGNAGLNLVAASRVIILDPFWNPFIEMQAVDRAYRIGQQNPVEVHRILIKNTVEDRIIELQDRKRKLVDSALDEGASKSLGRLNVNQLSYLFGVGGGPD